MTFNKKVLAGLVALAAASSAQAVTVAANDGWELGVSGSVNQFYTYTDDNANNRKTSEVRNGLLPAFLSFDMKAPTMNGLDIAAHISISPSTNGTSYLDGNGAAGNNALEQREVYFTVDGSFGQILAGKALGLYGSHNILTDQTLFGVGYSLNSVGTANDNLQTTLGGIGLGYDYANWRSQFKWTSNDMNGFKVALAVLDANQGASDTSYPRVEADLSYAGSFDGGSYSAWLSGMNEEGTDSDAYTVGATLAASGFEAMAQYSDSEAGAAEWDQYIVQAGYRFAGTTLVSAQYSERDNNNNNDLDKVTVGVYHDVNANLKLVAEYSQVEDDLSTIDADIFSVGGFVFF